MYRYRLVNQNDSSAKYGACEVCRQYASEVFHQIEQRRYKPGQWTQEGCKSYFGHRECLESKKRMGP